MNKKQTILTAALNLLTRQGIHATPMSAIAKEAGTGMGTIYNYFPNKEALINAIYIQIKQEEKCLMQVSEEGMNLRAQFEHYYKNGVQFFMEHPSYFHFMEQVQASPIITPESRAVGYEVMHKVIVLVEQGQKEGIIKKMPVAQLMPFVGGTMLSYLRLHFQERTQASSLHAHLQLVWDAIKV
ncbi:MAG: TetR/AcrR family transcriptional regulator [Aureispira sp.]